MKWPFRFPIISRYLSNQTRHAFEFSVDVWRFPDYVFRMGQTSYWCFLWRRAAKVGSWKCDFPECPSNEPISCFFPRKSGSIGAAWPGDVAVEYRCSSAGFRQFLRLVREISRYHWKTKRSLHKLYRHPIFINYIDNLHKQIRQPS